MRVFTVFDVTSVSQPKSCKASDRASFLDKSTSQVLQRKSCQASEAGILGCIFSWTRDFDCFFFRKSMKFLSSEGKDSLKLQLHFSFLKKLDDVIVTLSSLSILYDSISWRFGFLKYAEDVVSSRRASKPQERHKTQKQFETSLSLREGKTTENLITLHKHIHLGNCSCTSYFIPKRGQSQI